jgi:hypothetical protein
LLILSGLGLLSLHGLRMRTQSNRDLTFRHVLVNKDHALTLESSFKAGDQLALSVEPDDDPGLVNRLLKRDLEERLEVIITRLNRKTQFPPERFDFAEIRDNGYTFEWEDAYQIRLQVARRNINTPLEVIFSFTKGASPSDKETYQIKSLYLESSRTPPSMLGISLEERDELTLKTDYRYQSTFDCLVPDLAQTSRGNIPWSESAPIEVAGNYFISFSPKQQEATVNLEVIIDHRIAPSQPKKQEKKDEKEVPAFTELPESKPTGIDSVEISTPRSLPIEDAESSGSIYGFYLTIPPLSDLEPELATNETQKGEWICRFFSLSQKATYWIYWISAAPNAEEALLAFDDRINDERYKISVDMFDAGTIFSWNAFMIQDRPQQAASLYFPTPKGEKRGERFAYRIVDDPSELSLGRGSAQVRQVYTASGNGGLNGERGKHLCACTGNRFTPVTVYFRYDNFKPEDIPSQIPKLDWLRIENKIKNFQ